MKLISIVLCIVLLLAAAVFFSRDKSARADLQTAEQQVAGFSNEVAKVNILMALHASTNSELKQQITKQLERFSGLSNRLAKTFEDLKQAQQQHQTVRDSRERESKRAADGEIRIAELETELKGLRAAVEARDGEISRLRAQLQEAQTDRATFEARFHKAESDVVRLELDQTDEAALRAQLNRLKRQWPPVGFAKIPEQGFRAEAKGAQGLTAKVDTKATGYYLQIQPDGTLKLIPAMEGIGATR